MATITLKTGPTQQDKFLVCDHSNAISPFFQNGGEVAGHLRDGVDYEQGDTVIIQIPAATDINFAIITAENGSVITHTKGSMSNPQTGKTVQFAAGSNSHIYFLIKYKV